MRRLRLLLLQIRNPGDPMREQEIDCFADAAGVDREQITAYASRCGISIVSCYDVAGIPLLEKPRYHVA